MKTLDPADFDDKFDAWIAMITKSHHATNHRGVDTQVFTPLAKPLAECRVAIVSSAGVHRDDQTPFHVETVAGDPTHRIIPDDTDLDRLRFTHTHYDTKSAEQDPNVVFPLDRLHEAADEGRVGSVSDIHIGLMGFNPDPSDVADVAAPAVVDLLASAEVDVVVMVPG